MGEILVLAEERTGNTRLEEDIVNELAGGDLLWECRRVHVGSYRQIVGAHAAEPQEYVIYVECTEGVRTDVLQIIEEHAIVIDHAFDPRADGEVL